MNDEKGLPAGRQGFTLIELLVVIAIIAVLVAFGVANFVGARSRARDIQKKSDLQQMKNALHLYYNDYQNYPGPAATKATKTFNGCGAAGDAICGNSFFIGTTLYMKLLPQGYTWYYEQESNGDDFCLWTTLENTSDSEITNSQTRCSVCNDVGYTTTTDYVLCAD